MFNFCCIVVTRYAYLTDESKYNHSDKTHCMSSFQDYHETNKTNNKTINKNLR